MPPAPTTEPEHARTIGERWRCYLSTVIPAEASEGEIREAQRAFYAGASAALGICGLSGGTDIAPDDGRRMIADMLRDLETFSRL